MNLNSTSVKIFYEGMSGFPSLFPTNGSLSTILKTALVTGTTPVTVSSIIVVSGIATVTTSTSHNFDMIMSTVVGPVIKIVGSSTVLDSEWRISSVVNSTSFTFNCPGVSDITVSSEGITVQLAPAGWEAKFEDTNKIALRSKNVNSSKMYLRVDDTHGKSAYVRGYEQMTTIDLGTNPFPTLTSTADANLLWIKNNYSGSVAISWVIIASDRRFFYFPAWRTESNGALYYFGDLEDCPLTPDNKNYNCLITGSNVLNVSSSYLAAWSSFYISTYGPVIPRDVTGLSVAPRIVTLIDYYWGSAQPVGSESATWSLSYPSNAPSGNLMVRVIGDFVDSSYVYRGRFPGLLSTIQKTPLTESIRNIININDSYYISLTFWDLGNLNGNVFINLLEWV